jgi:hypothetical protein
MAIPPSKRVPVEQIQRLFNNGRYWQMVQEGILQQTLLKDRHPTSPRAPVPYCTRSQYISYSDDAGQEIARVHQYLLPDGTLGASGKPDPKRLLHDGILYFPLPEPDAN